MRYQGSLIEWNAARGFGFVRRHGDSDGKVFVHVRAFGHRGVQPTVGDVVTYAVERDEHGRPRAADVAFAVPAARRAVHGKIARHDRPRGGWRGLAMTAVVLGALGVFGWMRYQAHSAGAEHAPAMRSVPASMALPSDGPTPSGFTCSGKRHCSQMTSCAEATFYLRQCPGTLADGDGDGIPCEDQWCGH